MKARIRNINFDAHEQPSRATVKPRHGLVRGEWLNVEGEGSWFSSGIGNAKREAVPAIKRIEQMCESLRR